MAPSLLAIEGRVGISTYPSSPALPKLLLARFDGVQQWLSFAMEGLGVAASVIAVVESSAKVASLCLQYSQGVRHAKDDIIRLRKQVIDLENVSASVTQLLDGPNGSQLKTSRQLQAALLDGRSQLQELHETLAPKSARKAMSRLGFKSLTWPFQSKDADKIMQEFRRCTQAVSLALAVDQT